MKKIVSLALLLLLMMSCFACTSSSLNGTYTEYEINGELYTLYFSMTLKNGQYEFDENTYNNKEKSVKNISKGKYTIDKKTDIITFVEINGDTFEGRYENEILSFTFNSILYEMTKD